LRTSSGKHAAAWRPFLPPDPWGEETLPHLTRTERAEEDLIDIWVNIARDNKKAADSLLDRIDSVCRSLAAFPELGPARPDLAPDFRYMIVGRYLILYRIIVEGVEIVRVLHGARHLPDML
jgi:toxin ParE1/3/4